MSPMMTSWWQDQSDSVSDDYSEDIGTDDGDEYYIYSDALSHEQVLQLLEKSDEDPDFEACDLSFSGNKLVSGMHCVLERDAEGKIWIEDKSTNGTLLNGKCKISKKRVELDHGDEIHIVYRKNNPESNIAFVFQDMVKLHLEMSDSTMEYVPSENDIPTSEYADGESGAGAADVSEGTPTEASSAHLDVKKRKRTASFMSEHLPIKVYCTETQGQPTAAGVEDLSRDEPDNVHNEGRTETKKKDVKEDVKKDGKGDVKGDVKEDVKKDAKGDVKKDVKGDAKEDVKKDAKGDVKKDVKEDVKKDAKGDVKEFCLMAAPQDDTIDAIEESLTCNICQEIFHNCIGLQPCMHSFCAGCYSDWMPQSNECPSCRGKVTRINKNHLVNNLVEAYLKSHPDRVRPPEDIAEQDSKNTITNDMLYPKERLRRGSDSEFSDSSRSSNSSRDDYNSPTTSGSPTVHMKGYISKPMCRQCPMYTGPLPTGRGEDNAGTTELALAVGKGPVAGPSRAGTGGAGTGGAGPGGAGAGPGGVGPGGVGTGGAGTGGAGTCGVGTGGAGPGGAGSVTASSPLPSGKMIPSMPHYTCTADQTHARCLCCWDLVPQRDRSDPSIPPIACEVCYRLFCHAYWGCYANCQGCLGRLKDMHFGNDCLNNIIKRNVYESAVLENYMKMRNVTVPDMVAVCMERLRCGVYDTHDQIAEESLTPNTWLCRDCGFRNLGVLAYQYRRDIPKGQLPVGVTSRPDCYWGKNCRTQTSKPHHAANYNHICEQTRTS